MSSRQSNTYRGIDWLAFTSYVALVIIGWLMLVAAAYNPADEISIFSWQSEAGKQAIWVGISLTAFAATYAIDHTSWNKFSFPFYVLSLLLLVGVLILGTEINGARAWYTLGPVSFQPAEISKLATILFMSTFISGYKRSLKNRRDVLTALAIIGAPQLLILLQPDAGSALVFMSFFVMFYRFDLSVLYYIIGASIVAAFMLAIRYDPMWVLWMALAISVIVLALDNSPNIKNILIGGVPLISSLVLYLNGIVYPAYAVIGVVFIYYIVEIIRKNRATPAILAPVFVLFISMIGFGTNYLFQSVLRPHQQDRINVWLRPERCDPHGSLYNIIQSKLAIGSGGFSGKGFLEGDMTKLNYVPEQTTDFIFCTVGEEQGFVGVTLVILLFVTLIFRAIMIGERAKSRFVTAYAYGVAGILFFHFFFNIGMTLGVLPVIGIPLPFLSKGGSSLLVFSMMIAILLRMDVSRFRAK